MRKELLEVNSLRKAWDEAPWAARIVKVEGGYLAFESVSDYETWKNQKVGS